MLVNDEEKRDLIPKSDDFIKELSIQFLEEVLSKTAKVLKLCPDLFSKLTNVGQQPTLFPIEIQEYVTELLKRDTVIAEIAKDALTSLSGSEIVARFLYFVNHLQNPWYFMQWIYEWITEAYKKYPDSVLLKFLCGQVIYYYKGYQHAFDKNDINASIPWLTRANKSIFEKLQKPITDHSQLLLDALKADSEFLIDLQETYLELMKSHFEKYRSVYHILLYENFGRLLFPGLSHELFFCIFISSHYAHIAYCYLILDQKDRAKQIIENALSKYYKDDSYALALYAWLTLEEDSLKAEGVFKNLLKIVDSQYVGLPLQLQTKISAYLGLGYIYYKRTIYEVSEKYYDEALAALKLHSEPYLKAVILLNRGRNRLDNGDFTRAKEDFCEAQKMPLVSAFTHNNLGLIYFEQGLYEKSESEFIQAVEEQPDLAESYYNLGVLYNEENGNKERARKLFQTALDIDRGYKQAKESIRKLEHSSMGDIGDWYDWWFGSSASSLKKGMGIATLILIGVLIGKASYLALYDKDIKDPLLGMIGIAIVFLVLPLISKLKIGPIELEMESKGHPPPLM
jgi:tetratricopeptide (TPR) repeat protein